MRASSKTGTLARRCSCKIVTGSQNHLCQLRQLCGTVLLPQLAVVLSESSTADPKRMAKSLHNRSKEKDVCNLPSQS